MTADTALRLAQLFKTTPQFWMHMHIFAHAQCRPSSNTVAAVCDPRTLQLGARTSF